MSYSTAHQLFHSSSPFFPPHVLLDRMALDGSLWPPDPSSACANDVRRLRMRLCTTFVQSCVLPFSSLSASSLSAFSSLSNRLIIVVRRPQSFECVDIYRIIDTTSNVNRLSPLQPTETTMVEAWEVNTPLEEAGPPQTSDTEPKSNPTDEEQPPPKELVLTTFFSDQFTLPAPSNTVRFRSGNTAAQVFENGTSQFILEETLEPRKIHVKQLNDATKSL
jgi:hypothetical protein